MDVVLAGEKGLAPQHLCKDAPHCRQSFGGRGMGALDGLQAVLSARRLQGHAGSGRPAWWHFAVACMHMPGPGPSPAPPSLTQHARGGGHPPDHMSMLGP